MNFKPSLAGLRDTVGSPPPADSQDTAKLGIARYVAWILILLIVGFAVFLAVVFGNKARETLLTKQRNFAGILAEHLNQQIFVRFSIPIVVANGRTDLKNAGQYARLDNTVADLVKGLHVHALRIYDVNGEVKYSSRYRSEEGYKSPATEQLAQEALKRQESLFFVDRDISLWEEYLFFFRMKPGAFYLRATASMRPEVSAPVVGHTASVGVVRSEPLGILEITQDITKDMADIVRFQWTIVGVTLASALLLFFLLMFFLRRAETALAARMVEQQRLLRELHQHEKLAGMGRVVAGIAHEIRNPLGIIQSSAELLLSRPAAEDPVFGKILRAIFDESRRLSQTVSDFLDYARPRQPQQNRVDAAKTVRDVLAFLEPEVRARNITVIADLAAQGQEENSLCTSGDKDLLYRAFYNILTNSIQAMGENGTIIITARPHTDGRDGMEILFADSGPGFPVEDRERFLDPFVTTKDGGTGLGLPIVNNIITSHGGTMTLEDAPGGGAQVRVLLPAASPA